MGWIPVPETDPTAIHSNISGEFAAITQKASPVDDDLLLIEDSAASNAKKRILIGSLPSAGGGKSYATQPADKPPDSANALDDEFDGSSLDGKWTWRNQGTATAVVSHGRLRMNIPANNNGSPALRIIEQNAPSTPFTITAKIGHLARDVNFSSSGLCLIDSVSGRVLRWGIGWDNPWAILGTQFSSVTGFNANVERHAGTFTHGVFSHIYLRMEDDGTNINLYYSPNGLDFDRGLLYSQARSSYLSNGADKIGLCANTENNPNTAAMTCDWFRVNWTPDWDPAVDS